MNILYVAFPCNPYVGSESKIGWNIPIESSKFGNKVTVVTILDMKKDIDDYCKTANLNNIKFLYVDINKTLKKIIKKMPTLKLKLYHALILRKIKKVKKNGDNFDLIHQITPVEFRSIGNYYKIKNTKFIVGPVGGGEYIPASLKKYEEKKFVLEYLRKILNLIEKFKLKLNKKKISKTEIMFANEETKNYLRIDNGQIITEVGLQNNEINFNKKITVNEYTTFIVSGRLIYRKGHELLLNVIESVPSNLKYTVRIIGMGREFNKIKQKIEKSENLRQHVELIGNIEYKKMKEEYSKADVLIMPSLRETTGSVLLEAMGNGLTVIAMNKFGAKLIIDNSNGYLYDGKDRQELENSLRQCIIACIKNKDELESKRKKALADSIKYTFENKIKKYSLIYINLLKNGGNK